MNKPPDTEGPVCFPGIERLAKGQRIDERPLTALLDAMDRRGDCADFRMVCVLRSLYDFPSLLSQPSLQRIRRSVLGFRYAMADPGGDSMCFWSENHQLLFAACEYLAGQRYPDELFTNTGKAGRWHRDRGRARLEDWFDTRLRLGFSEWHSSVYYEEDAAALSLLTDLSADEPIARQAAALMDLLLLDMALHSFRGYMGAASGRCYEAQKCDLRRQHTLGIARKAFGLPEEGEPDYSGLTADFLLNRRYRVPPLIRAIARDEGRAVVRTSMGLDLREVAGHFADAPDPLAAVRYLWSMEAFVNPEAIGPTLEAMERWKLQDNRFLRPLGRLLWLRRLPAALLRGLVRLLDPAQQGTAIQRGDTYTCRTADYMLSTAQAHCPGGFGDQQHIWQATLPGPVSVFTTHPGGLRRGEGRDTPSHWVGSGILPFAAQHEGVLLCLYDLRRRRGLMEGRRQLYSHAWFPLDAFDEARVLERLALGRSGDGYIALLSLRPLARVGAAELRQPGRLTAWAALMGSRAEHGGFDRFCRLAEAAVLSHRPGRLSLTAGGRRYELAGMSGFLVDGRPQRLRYQRLESPYGGAPRGSGAFELRFGDLTMRLGGGWRGGLGGTEDGA